MKLEQKSRMEKIGFSREFFPLPILYNSYIIKQNKMNYPAAELRGIQWKLI